MKARLMTARSIMLVEPTMQLRDELLAMAEEYRAAGDDRYREAIEDVSGFIQRAINYAHGRGLRPGHVPATFYWLVQQGRIIGRSGIRHHLTPALENEGGHIGYDIRPSERGKGYGTLILKLTLEKAREFGFDRVMLTCDADNIASARIIEKNGGKIAAQVISERSGKLISHYWI